MIEEIRELFSSELSSYKISKESGVPENTVRRLRSGEAKLENATYKNIKALYNYYKELGKMNKHPNMWDMSMNFGRMMFTNDGELLDDHEDKLNILYSQLEDAFGKPVAEEVVNNRIRNVIDFYLKTGDINFTLLSDKK